MSPAPGGVLRWRSSTSAYWPVPLVSVVQSVAVVVVPSRTEEFRSLRVPTLLAASDAGQAPPSHYVEMLKLLDGGLRDGGWMGENRPKGGHALAILPGLTHYDTFASPLLVAVTLSFLDAPSSASAG